MGDRIRVYWECADTNGVWRVYLYSGADFRLAQLNMKAAMEDERPNDAVKLHMEVLNTN